MAKLLNLLKLSALPLTVLGLFFGGWGIIAAMKDQDGLEIKP